MCMRALCSTRTRRQSLGRGGDDSREDADDDLLYSAISAPPSEHGLTMYATQTGSSARELRRKQILPKSEPCLANHILIFATTAALRWARTARETTFLR
jgi:hypothetical protein